MLTVHIISDSIGNTAKDVVDAALVQFSYGKADYKVLKNSNVCTIEKIDCIMSNVNDNFNISFLDVTPARWLFSSTIKIVPTSYINNFDNTSEKFAVLLAVIAIPITSLTNLFFISSRCSPGEKL